MSKFYMVILMLCAKRLFQYVDIVKGEGDSVHAITLTNHESYIDDISHIEPRKDSTK